MCIEQSAKNTGVHWNAISHKLIWSINTVVRFILLPWMVLLFLVITVVVEEWATGDLGRNGGMTGLFQSMGLHPHTTYEAFLWITGIGVFFAMSWLLWHLLVAGVGTAKRQMQNSGMKEWFAQKAAPLQKGFADFESSHPRKAILAKEILAFMIVVADIVVTGFFIGTPPKNQMIVWPHGGPVPVAPQIKVLTNSYGHVLLRMPG